jgi:hypothetical protein
MRFQDDAARLHQSRPDAVLQKFLSCRPLKFPRLGPLLDSHLAFTQGFLLRAGGFADGGEEV